MRKNELLAYKYAESLLDDIQNKTHVTKEAALNMLRNDKYEVAEEFLLRKLSKKESDVTCVMSMSKALGIAAGVINAPHFLVSNHTTLPSYGKFDFIDLPDLPDEFTVNFTANEIPMFINVLKRIEPIVTADATYTHSINVIAQESSILNLLSSNIIGGCFSKYIPLVTIHLNADKKTFIEVGYNDAIFLRALDNDYEFSRMNVVNPYNLAVHEVIATTIYSLNKFLGMTTSLTYKKIFNAVNHAAHCYVNRSNTRKLNKLERTNTVKIHTPSVDSSNDLHVVTLREYVKTYERKPYQGGHHNSPCAHERRGFFRKSRGRGLYSLVNGEYVNVGRGNGEYSYIHPTKVNPKNENKVIYKV